MGQAVTFDFPNGAGSYSVDAATAITITYAAEITEHAVQDGAKFTDHRDRNPPTISISGIISNCHPGRETGALDSEAPGYYTEFRDKMLEAERDSLTLTVDLAKRGVFRNMLINTLSLPYTPESGGSLPFEITLTQVVIAETKKKNLALAKVQKGVEGIVNSPAVKARWNKVKNLGGIPALAAKAKTEALARSAAFYKGVIGWGR